MFKSGLDEHEKDSVRSGMGRSFGPDAVILSMVVGGSILLTAPPEHFIWMLPIAFLLYPLLMIIGTVASGDAPEGATRWYLKLLAIVAGISAALVGIGYLLGAYLAA